MLSTEKVSIPALTGLLVAALLFTQTGYAQDAATIASQLAAQQATQQAAQQAALANQQAVDAAAQQQSIIQQQQRQATDNGNLPPRPGYSTSQPPPAIPNGPLPARIAAARTVLLTNGGTSARVGLDSNSLYNEIHARMVDWGYYQLVSSPQAADLIFQFDVIDPRNGGNTLPDSYDYRTPMFRVVIVDARTGVPLWTIRSPIVLSPSKKTYAHFLSVSEANLITRMKAVAQQPTTPAEQAALNEYPKTHEGLVIGLVAAGSFALLGGVIALGIHSGKAHQDAFCQANNIPQNMCAGG